MDTKNTDTPQPSMSTQPVREHLAFPKSISSTSFNARSVRMKISQMLATGITLENKELCMLKEKLKQHLKKEDELLELRQLLAESEKRERTREINYAKRQIYLQKYGMIENGLKRTERAIYNVSKTDTTNYCFAYNTMDLKFNKQQELQSKLLGIERSLNNQTLEIISTKKIQEQRNIIIEQLAELGLIFNKSSEPNNIIYVTRDYVSPKSISSK